MDFMPLLLLAVCLICGIPFAFSLIIAIIPYFITEAYLDPGVIIQRLISNAESSSLMAIPLFIMAGSIMNYSGVTKRLLDLCELLVGHKVGGLGHVNVLLSAFMGGISGSGNADAAMECKLLVPQMEARGYSRPFSGAVTVASAVITPIIPPGIALIVYAYLCQVSTGKLLVAGYVPGIMLTIGMMVVVSVVSKKNGYVPSRERMGTAKEFLHTGIDAIWALIIPFGLILLLRMGACTATEGGALIAVYSLIIGKFVYKDLKIAHIPEIIKETVYSTCSVMFIMCAASAFSYYLTWEQIPKKLSTALIEFCGDRRFLFLLLVNLLLLVIGMFFDGLSAMIMLAPILGPVAQALGIDMIHFGIVVVLNTVIGAITPPFGTFLFLVSTTIDVKMEALVKSILPFLGVCIAVLFLITYIPGLVTFVPNLIY